MPFDFIYRYRWLIFAVVMAIYEVNTTALVSVWFVVGSLCAFVTSFFTGSLFIQIAVFTVVSAVSLAAVRPMVKRLGVDQTKATNANMLIGKICTVTEDIRPDKKGRVKVGDVYWMASCDLPMEKGEKAQILSISGATLAVKPVSEKVFN